MGDIDLDLSNMAPGLTVQSLSPSWKERQMKILEGDVRDQVKELLVLLNENGIDLHRASIGEYGASWQRVHCSNYSYEWMYRTTSTTRAKTSIKCL